MVVSNAQKPKSKPNKFMPSFSWDAVNIYFDLDHYTWINFGSYSINRQTDRKEENKLLKRIDGNTQTTQLEIELDLLLD